MYRIELKLRGVHAILSTFTKVYLHENPARGFHARLQNDNGFTLVGFRASEV